MDQKTKKKLFISGPVSGKAYYWKDFEDARKYYTERGFAVMIPSELPVGMRCADYARVCLAMIDSADEVAFLPGWEESAGARLEMEYCSYTGKPTRMYGDDINAGPKEYRCDLEGDKLCINRVIESGMPVCGSQQIRCGCCTVVPKRPDEPSSSDTHTDELHARAKKAMEPYANASFNPAKTASGKESFDPKKAASLYEKLLAAVLPEKERGAVKVKNVTDVGDAVKIDMAVDLDAFGAEPEEEQYDAKCFAVSKAVDEAFGRGYQIDLSMDENGWLSVGLYPTKEGSK